MSVQENIARYNDALDAVHAHCMAAHVEHASGKAIIYYPEGYWPNGIRVDDTAKGLASAIPLMEKHWLASFPSGSGMV